MTYNEYLQTMNAILDVPNGGADVSSYKAIVPRMIEYAERRLIGEMDFLATVKTANADLTSGTRDVAVPGSILIVQSVNVVTPAATLPDAGTRVPLERTSLDFINQIWPNAATTGVPQYYAALTDASFRLAPTPDAAYKAEFIGMFQPTPLAPDNPTTFISLNLPHLFIAASCVFGFGYQRDFGAQSDDPRTAQSWEAQYQALLPGVMIQELRRKAQSTGWSPYQPSPAANTPRDRNAAG